MANNPNAVKNLKPCKKGHTANPNGRPPKIATILKKEGLTESQVRDIASEMLAMTIDELKKIATDPKSKSYEVMLAVAIKNAMQKGDISQVFGMILPRLFGQPKQQIDTTVKGGSVQVNIIGVESEGEK